MDQIAYLRSMVPGQMGSANFPVVTVSEVMDAGAEYVPQPSPEEIEAEANAILTGSY